MTDNERTERERVARAICVAEGNDPDAGGSGWCDDPDWRMWRRWEEAADAAIAALRPTDSGLVALEIELEGARQRAADAEHRLYAFRQGRAARSKALTEFVKARAPDLWSDYAAVWANGSIYSDEFTMEPTYEREMNILRHRAEKAEEAATALRAQGQDERAEIVAFVRANFDAPHVAEVAKRIADAIEAGQHKGTGRG